MKKVDPLLRLWRGMHNRCYKQSQGSYKHYGGRGIFVHPSWHGVEGFQNFLRDMGPRETGMTIERIDNDGPYSSDNCKWVSRNAQSRNKRNNRWISCGEETLTLKDWANRLGCNPAAILARIKSGMSEEEAVTKPVPKRPNSRLSESDVRSIRSIYPVKTMQALADEFGVSKKTIANVVHNKIFVDVI